MPQQHTFQLRYLREQLKIVSDKRPDPQAGKYFSNFNHSPEQQSLFVLLLAERIKEMERAEKGKVVDPEY
jgi:hypothetical protein